MPTLPEIDLTDPAVLNDPFTAYRAARERSAVARLHAPGMPPMWGVLRHAEARAMLSDPARFALSPASYAFRLEVSDELQPYLHTVQEMEGAKHVRLRKLVAPAFTARRAADFRSRIEPIVDELLDGLWCQPGIGAERGELVGVREQRLHGVGDEVARGLPGEDEQPDERDELDVGEPVAVLVVDAD